MHVQSQNGCLQEEAAARESVADLPVRQEATRQQARGGRVTSILSPRKRDGETGLMTGSQ